MESVKNIIWFFWLLSSFLTKSKIDIEFSHMKRICSTPAHIVSRCCVSHCFRSRLDCKKASNNHHGQAAGNAEERLQQLPQTCHAMSESSYRQRRAWTCELCRYEAAHYYPLKAIPLVSGLHYHGDNRGWTGTSSPYDKVRCGGGGEFTARLSKMKSERKSAWFKCKLVNNAKRGPSHIVHCWGAAHWSPGGGHIYIVFICKDKSRDGSH